MNVDDYPSYDGLGLAQLVHSGEVRAEELLEAAIAQNERLNPHLNAVIRPMYEEARQVVRSDLSHGPFRGVPFLLKDLLSLYAGVPTSAGSRLLVGHTPQYDSELVRRYRAAGLVMMGKTNTPEFGLLPYTEPECFGPTRNPWDLSRIPGGSSGGSAAAVAAGIVPLAGGGDGGGSIRIPASCCGLFGLKPTRGRTPTGPHYGEIWSGCVIEHVLTRSVRDSAAMLDAVSGPDIGAPYHAPPPSRPFLDDVGTDPGKLRVAFTAKPLLGANVHEDCRRALDETAHLLEDLGHHVEEAAPVVEREEFSRAFIIMLAGELRADVTDAMLAVGRKVTPRDLEPGTWALALMGDRLSAAQYASAVRYLQRAARRVAGFFEQYDVLLTPTLAAPPPPIGALRPPPGERRLISLLGRLRAGWLLEKLGTIDRVSGDAFAFTPFTPVFNVTGQPAMSVPLAWNDEGLPIGMHFAARFGDEAMLFRLAAQLEAAKPWFDRRPGIS